ALFLIGVTLFTGFSWLKAADFLGERVWRIGNYLRTLLTRIDQWAVNSTEKEIPVEIIEAQADEPKLNSTQESASPSKTKPKIHRIEPKIAPLTDSKFVVDPHEPFISTLATTSAATFGGAKIQKKTASSSASLSASLSSRPGGTQSVLEFESELAGF